MLAGSLTRVDLGRIAGTMALSSFLKFVRRKLSEVLRARSASDPTGRTVLLQEYSELSHFIFDTRHFSSARSRVKPPAFVPYPRNRVSAFWIDELLEPEVWRIGDEVAGAPRQKQPIARADFSASVLAEINLTIQPDPIPHPRHVDICGWPTEKDAQKAVALEMCARSTLRIR